MAEETIKGFPITNHFLKFEEGAWTSDDEYRIPWNEPNVKWRIRKIQGTRQLITNIQYDDSPHAPDLFLYTNVSPKEIPSVYDVAEDNVIALNCDRRWYVKQVVKQKNRIGLRQFTTLPLGPFRDYWRKPIMLDKISIGKVGRGLSSVGLKISGCGVTDSKFRAFLDFPEMEQSSYEQTLTWLKENCHDGVYLFSDNESMFVDPMDEFAFIASCVSRSDR